MRSGKIELIYHYQDVLMFTNSFQFLFHITRCANFQNWKLILLHYKGVHCLEIQLRDPSSCHEHSHDADSSSI